VAVLLYRVFSFWLTLPTGWGAWAWLAWTGRSRPRPRKIAGEPAADARAADAIPAAEPGGISEAAAG
jgi:hypothetical protein